MILSKKFFFDFFTPEARKMAKSFWAKTGPNGPKWANFAVLGLFWVHFWDPGGQFCAFEGPRPFRSVPKVIWKQNSFLIFFRFLTIFDVWPREKVFRGTRGPKTLSGIFKVQNKSFGGSHGVRGGGGKPQASALKEGSGRFARLRHTHAET